ncbi:unnamed protein product [Moneuplotes crassus]|uniref:Uncharacterized protein n=1 Tax=Euplotes crassus TaxID=5936 RepID=A0AAD1U9G2_EUPCR|nr:unnamed protein product [Moneuplotes crassus]
MHSRNLIQSRIRRTKSTPRGGINKPQVKTKLSYHKRDEALILENPKFQKFALDKFNHDKISQNLLIQKLKMHDQKYRDRQSKSIKTIPHTANYSSYLYMKNSSQTLHQKYNRIKKKEHLVEKYFVPKSAKKPTVSMYPQKFDTSSVSRSIEDVKENSRSASKKRNNLSTNRGKSSNRSGSRRRKGSFKFQSSAIDMSRVSKKDARLLRQEGVNTFAKLFKKKVEQYAENRYKIENFKMQYKELSKLIINDDEIKIPIDSISKKQAEICSDIIEDLSIVANITFFSDEANPSEIAEFDKYLDTKRMKKAVHPRHKRSKNTNDPLARKKPLSMMPSHNKTFVPGLAPNFVNNKRLVKFQICGIHFGKESWRNILKYAGEAVHLQVIAINKCVITQQILEDLEKALFKCETCHTVDLRDNNLTDEFGGLIVRLIQAQTEKRDGLIWAYDLRNEYPSHLDKVGLKSIILRRNKLGKLFMKKLAKWVVNDEYLRHIDLCYNKIGPESLKTFISKLQHNHGLVSLEFRGNHGFTKEVQSMTVSLLLKNIENCKKSRAKIKPEWIKKDVFDIDIPKNIHHKIENPNKLNSHSININTPLLTKF